MPKETLQSTLLLLKLPPIEDDFALNYQSRSYTAMQTRLTMKTLSDRKKLSFIAALTLTFFFRLLYGLSLDFRPDVGDERQIYLIGLKYYTTRNWPYFGPDVTDSIQIPGALQGLVVGLPFSLVPIPEAPHIILNVLSFFSLCLFSWYCSKRLPDIPRWFVWAWLLTVPWTLNLSTQVYNVSYVLIGSIVFFVGAIETLPGLTQNVVPSGLANFMMGLALFWVMQFHLSWAILVPYILVSLYFQYRTKGRRVLASVAWFSCGAILTASFLIPTYLKYGLVGGMGGSNEAARINLHNLWRHLNIVEGVLGRFLSFASFELPRFIGDNTAMRLAFMKMHPWLIAFIIFLTIVGILQPIMLAVFWFAKNGEQTDWKPIKFFTLWTIVLLYVAFLFSVKAPLSHTFYVTFPVSMLYSLYCWRKYLVQPRWRKFSVAVIVCGIIFHAGLAIHNYSRVSLYLVRSQIQQAIESKNYHLLGERRPNSRY